jgi:hypothetical protein
MNPLDHFIKRELKCKGYVRYVDDLLLFGDDKVTLWEWKAAIVEKLATLRLTLHPHAHPRPVTEGIPFLGFVVYPTHRRLKRRKIIHFSRRLKQRVVQHKTGEISDDELTAVVQGWVNHASHGDTWRLRGQLLNQILLDVP